MQDEAKLCDCLQDIQDSDYQEATSIINQCYKKYRKFRRIEKDSMFKISDKNVRMSTMKVFKFKDIKGIESMSPGEISVNDRS